MLRRFPVFCVLMLLAHPVFGWAQDEDSDALKLLSEAGKQYADARSYHIESVRESRTTEELRSSWSKEFLRAEQAPGNRYRYEGATADGSGIVISDGATEWNLYRSYGDYTKKPAGAYSPYSKSPEAADSRPENEAYFLRSTLAVASDYLRSAHFLKDATISIAGHKVACYVVTYGPEDLRRALSPARTTQTFWIDKSRKVIVKTLTVSDSTVPWDPFHPIKHPSALHIETVTTYPVVELDSSIPESDFGFSPPEDASLVDILPSPIRASPAPAAVSGSSAPARQPPNMIGRIAPAKTYYAADGSSFRFDSLRGHPVLIDLWATWCTPCLQELPLIARLETKARAAGLATISLDEDTDSDAAESLLKRKGYPWADYHISAGTGSGFPHTGVPLHVLLNSDGRIIYYHDGVDDDKGLVAAIRNLGAAYSAALADEGNSR